MFHRRAGVVDGPLTPFPGTQPLHPQQHLSFWVVGLDLMSTTPHFCCYFLNGALFRGGTPANPHLPPPLPFSWWRGLDAGSVRQDMRLDS